MYNHTQKYTRFLSTTFFTRSIILAIILPIALAPFLFGAHTAYAAATTSISLESYIFENDDNTNNNIGHADNSTQMAAGSTTITNVKKGERLSVRMHIKNTGGNSLASTSLGLFYDRNDGYWSKVRANAVASTTAGNCTDTNWDCSVVDNFGNTGSYTSLAFDPLGKPWLSYWEISAGNLVVATLISTSSASGISQTWATTTVDATNDVGLFTSIAFAQGSTTPWVSYKDSTNGSLRVARFVGTGGTGCATTEWTCTTIDATSINIGVNSSMAFDLNGNPWIAYYDFTNANLRVARFVRTGGTGCSVTSWTCYTVDSTNDAGQYSSLAFDSSGVAWVSYRYWDTSDLRVARFVGSSGTGCAITTWTCVAVDTTNSVGHYSSIAIDQTGNPWISYHDFTNLTMRVAQYVGTGGTGCALTSWTCTAVVSVTDTPEDYSLAFDALGNPWISYYDAGTRNLLIVRYVGSGGTGCTSSAWTCSAVDTPNDVGRSSALAFDQSGHVWIGYRDVTNTDLRIARQKRSGEIVVSPATSFQFGTSTFLMSTSTRESHVDMMTVTDTTNRDDIDCVTVGATWNNGFAFQSEEGYGVILPAGNATAQCTEISFTIDTSQAKEGTTYRLALATKDNWRPDQGIWRGPRGGASSTFPTFTIQTATTSVRISKDVQFTMPNCADTNWGCAVVQSANDVGVYTSLAFDPAGNPWVSYNDGTNGDLRVARYVGFSGTGCATAVWTCTTIHTTNAIGFFTSLAFDPSGNPWVSYQENTNGDLYVARYVGTGGTGCALPSWTCTAVDTANVVGFDISLAFDHAGNPWVSYQDITSGNLRVARYVGSGGTGCASVAWTCAAVHTTNDVSGYQYTSIAFDLFGNPWVSYFDNNAADLSVARYVGTGGTGCASVAWTCTAVDTANDVGRQSSLAFDPAGNSWVSYRDNTNLDLRVARYVGSGGTGCASTQWTCTAVDTTNDVGQYTAIAFDLSGNPWVTYKDFTNTDLRVARYVSSGGTGCAVTSWTCTAVDTATTVGGYKSIAFDLSGSPWVSYRDNTNGDLRIAKLHLPPTKLSATSSMRYNGRNASHGDSRYRLGVGKSPRTDADGTCSGNIDSRGYCGVLTDDTDYDAITGQASTSPLFSGAFLNANNSDAPTITWTGQSSVSPTTNLISIAVYRFGTTNAWTTLTPTSNTCTATGVNTDCTIVAGPTTNLTEYYEVQGLDNWMYVRVYQAQSSTTATTLKTDRFTFVTSTPTPVISQLHYRFRMDEGGEVTAPWITGEDTPVTLATTSLNVYKGDRRRLRILISNATADASNVAYRLEYSSSSCAAWTAVATNGGATTQEWVMDYSQYVPEGGATTHASGLTAPGGKSFVAGQIRVESNQTTATTITSSQYSEFEYAFRSTTIAQTAVTYCFRLTNAGVTTNFVYSVQPQMTLSGVARPQAGGVNSENSASGTAQGGGGVGGGGSGEGNGGGPPVGGGGAGGGGGGSG